MLDVDIAKIKQAAALLKQGQLVAFPTDTLYGLGADATNEAAILQVFKAKQRELTKPLAVHIPNIKHLNNWVDITKVNNALLKKLTTKYWPGALTIVLPKAKNVSSLITSSKDNIAIRIPNHPVALALLQEFNSGIIGTSANISGHINPVSSEQVKQEFNNSIFILEGGDCPLAQGSTIVALNQEIKILRVGAVSI